MNIRILILGISSNLRSQISYDGNISELKGDK
jgi:hypothetical protein